MNKKWIFVVVVIVGLALGFGAGKLFNFIRSKMPTVITQKEYQQSSEIREAKEIERVDIPMKSIKVLNKQKVIKQIKGLPEKIKGDNYEISGTAKVTKYEGETSVVSTIDKSTGVTELFSKKEPLPFVSVDTKFQIGLSFYPFHSANVGSIVLDTNYEVGRIWKIKGGARGEIDEKGNWRAGVRAYMEF